VATEAVREWRREVKTALKRGKLPDTYFVSSFAAAPYHACAHGCLYCDGRAEKYYVEGEFERDITIRANFPAVFAADVAKLRERGIVMFGSGVTDPYQPLEAREKLMRAAAETLLEAGLPALILTKSALPLRDLDLWAGLAACAGCTLYVSLVTLDDRVRAAFEPGASPVDERLEMLRAFKAAGCNTGILAMPLLPGICDGEAQMDALFRKAAELHVDVLMPGGLTLRPGRQKNTYLAALERYDPSLVPFYQNLYRENRSSGAPLPQRSERLRPLRRNLLRRHGLQDIVSHRLYRNRLALHDELFVLLHHLEALYPAADTRPLREARNRYRDWLLERKAFFARRRRLSYRILEEELRGEFACGRFRAVLANDRLFAFLANLVLADKTLDYHTLSWQ